MKPGSLVRLVAALIAPALLMGCVTGLPWGHRKDANAAQAVDQAAPLIAQCRQQFGIDLSGKADAVASGPTLVEDGSVTTVRLDALMRGQPTANYARAYSCEFDAGKLAAHGLVEE